MTFDFLYAEIGRGHPFYLDGIRSALPDSATVHVDNVFTRSRGISLLGWQLARGAYAWGSSRSGGRVYTRL
ncbi:MAG: hypothetical protein O3C57_00340, partial [Verrucomicrobia bacterium]|nr:hypothetical protein [Verrucomicrobiota bacterium]